MASVSACGGTSVSSVDVVAVMGVAVVVVVIAAACAVAACQVSNNQRKCFACVVPVLLL